MHIEPGYIVQAKVLAANGALAVTLAWHGRTLLYQPTQILRTLLAALFFSLFMQSFHMSVGPSELHFIGAMPIYLALGFLPTLFGFCIGLLLQGLIFEPTDLPHLAVNSLSLIVPLIAVHYTLGKALRRTTNGHHIDLSVILKLDAAYYAGVVTMVGFWLLLADVGTPLAAWGTFAASYLTVVLLEPVFTYASLHVLKRYQHTSLVRSCFAVSGLKLVG